VYAEAGMAQAGSNKVPVRIHMFRKQIFIFIDDIPLWYMNIRKKQRPSVKLNVVSFYSLLRVSAFVKNKYQAM
jgi:hypothetical protein